MKQWFSRKKSDAALEVDPPLYASQPNEDMKEEPSKPAPAHGLGLEPPPEDINAIGATEKAFPIWLVTLLAAMLALILFGAAFWVKTSLPFATNRKEEYPSKRLSADEPVRNAPNLDISPPTMVQPASLESHPGALAPPAIVPAVRSTATPDTVCGLTTVLDKTSLRPVTDASGAPILVDCHGVYSPRPAIPEPASTPAHSGHPLEKEVLPAPSTGNSGPPDRYAGEALLSHQLVTKTDVRPVSPGAPQLPSPPVGAADVLRQLEALRSVPAHTTPVAPILINPLGTASAAAKSSLAPNTQGRPGDMLVSDKTERSFAVKSIDENLVIPKGTQVDCGLTTRAVTEISGFASCQVARDVYSANGRVLLIERMATVEGEYAAQSQAGQKYIHVLWTRLRKPGGVTIDIASPATDGLGGAGIAAFVDNRWSERLAGAYMLSFIKDAIAYKTAVDAQSGQSAVGAIAYQNTIRTSEAMAEKVLSNTIGIKPILYANQGDRVAIYVARDLDFSKIYDVRAK